METYSFFTPLYDSTVCRLCGLDNSQGVIIYDSKEEFDLAKAINKYLPITVEDDEKLPRAICPGCHIQVSSTVQFFNLIVEGQSRIRDLYAQEVKMEKEKIMLRKSIENQNVTIVTDESTEEEAILIKLFPNEPFFSDDQELTLLVQGLDKPKRKPGRPRKSKPTQESPAEETAETIEQQEEHQESVDEELEVGGHRLRRKRKAPQRFSEVVAGRELDQVLLEEGAIDEYDVAVSGSQDEATATEKELKESDDSPETEVIGHLQTADGEIAAPILAQSGARLARRKKKKTRVKFECDFCNMTFGLRTKWIKHRAIHKGCSFQCLEQKCFEVFSSLNKLKAHQTENGHSGSEIVKVIGESQDGQNVVEEEEGPFFCDGCEAVATSSAEMLAHMQTEHPQLNEDQPETSVPEENVAVPDGEKLADPATQDDAGSKKDDKNVKKKYSCEVCWREFSHLASLIYHRDSFHNNGVRFACNKCEKTFSHKLLLQRHQIVHSDLRPFNCKKCDLSFKSKSNLINHQVVHSRDRKHSCDICGQSFIHRTSLNLHIQAHKGVRPYKCSLCPKSFTQYGNLNDHMRIHYGEKPFVCNVCGKAFTTASQQRLHSMRHTGERPWKCQYCGKRYLHKDTWRIHERRHTGEKPFQCGHCTKAFSEPWALKKHIRLHTGEKPYKCDICGKEFADCSNLTKHKKVHLNGTTKLGSKKSNVPNNSVGQVYYLMEEPTGSPKDTFDDTQDAVVTFSDEDGNPLRLPLPDGRSADVLSLDLKKNIVHVRTSDGAVILMQLSRQFNTDTELLECVRDSITSLKPTVAEVVEGGESQSTRPRLLKEKKTTGPAYALESEIQIDDMGRAFIYSLEDEDEKSDAADFSDGLSNVYFVSNE